jgi:hypothetical protein
MAKVIELSPPENAGEKLVLEYLKANLPDTCIVLGNLSVPARNGAAQIDAVILAQLGVCTVEVKDWKGKLVGRTNGAWRREGKSMPNPCEQAVIGGKKLRTYVREHAEEIYGDKRLFHSLEVYTLVVLVDPQADTSQVNVEESRYLRMCRQLEELIPKIHECQSDTKKFLQVVEIQKMAEMFGVPKGELDTWAQSCSSQVMSHGDRTASARDGTASARDGTASVPYVGNARCSVPARRSVPTLCPQCSTENRAGAKFCTKCGGKLMP